MSNLAIFITGLIITGLCITFAVGTIYGSRHAERV